jgi:hypothetical protein
MARVRYRTAAGVLSGQPVREPIADNQWLRDQIAALHGLFRATSRVAATVHDTTPRSA